jgi:hypothetical protein
LSSHRHQRSLTSFAPRSLLFVFVSANVLFQLEAARFRLVTMLVALLTLIIALLSAISAQ